MDNPMLTLTLVHSDDRGEIFSISLPNNRELLLLHSKKGSLRGGHSHDVPESVMVLTGSMLYHKMSAEGLTFNRILGNGDLSINPIGLIHMGEFLEDTWLVECKDAEIGSSRTTDYEPWRSRVKNTH